MKLLAAERKNFQGEMGEGRGDMDKVPSSLNIPP